MSDDIKRPTPSLAELSCAALAYLGDSVLELCVREHLIRRGLSTSAHLNDAARQCVTAPAQAQAMQRILPVLTEQEAAVFRRGRNNIHANVPKRASVSEYRAATGMECLFAYLYLSQNQARIDELFALAYPAKAENQQTERT
jgi:ribonuclease-3 family protein